MSNFAPVLFDVATSTLNYNEGAGNVPISVSSALVDVRDYGAVCDGTTDDTTAIQSAVDAALLAGKGILVPGICKLTASINLNRPVDGLTPNMVINGLGQGGFTVSTAITMFTSSTAGTTSPVSEGFIFDGLKFLSTNDGLAAYTVTSKLLRCIWRNCEWRKMKFINSSIYTRSHYFSDCVMLNWFGTWYSSVNSFDIRFSNCRPEHGAAFYKDTGTYCNMSFNGGAPEGNTGICFDIANATGVLIQGAYFEANFLQDIKFGAGDGACVIGNWFYAANASYAGLPDNQANTSFYCIDWGTAKGVSMGNRCVGRLHDNDSSDVRVINDNASLGLMKANNIGPDGSWFPFTSTLTAGSGTITSGTATVRYKPLGDRTIAFSARLQITNNGTGASHLRFTLPFNAASAGSASGQNAATGKQVSGAIPVSSNICFVAYSDASYPGGASTDINISGIYEI